MINFNEMWDGFYDRHLNLIITTTWIPQSFFFDLIASFLEDVFEASNTSHEATIALILELALDHLSLVTCLTVFLNKYEHITVQMRFDFQKKVYEFFIVQVH